MIEKKKNNFFKIVSKIVDILVYPIILFSLLSSAFMIIANSESVVKPIFNHTFVRVLSSSMSVYCENAGRNFEKGDMVILRTNTTYEVGDIIAFYKYTDPADKLMMFNLTSYGEEVVPKRDKDGSYIKNKDGTIQYKINKFSPILDEDGRVRFNSDLYNQITESEVGTPFYYSIDDKEYTKLPVPSLRKSREKIESMKCDVYFHQIVQIKIDESGQLFYITKGTANSGVDSPVRADMVVGKYAKTPKSLTAFIGFCASTFGMLVLVIIPVSIVILIESLSILEQINNILLEKKVISRSEFFDTNECKKADIGYEMRENDKIYYYDVMPLELKEDVYDFLWGCLENSKNKNELNIYTTSKLAVDVYDSNDTERYYEIWENCFDSKRKKKLIREAQIRAEVDRYKDVKIVEYQNFEVDSDNQESELIEDVNNNTQNESKKKPKQSFEDIEQTKKEYEELVESLKEDIKTKKTKKK